MLPCASRRYRAPDQPKPGELPCGVFGSDWIVFERVGGQALPARRAPDVTRALRGMLLKHLQGASDALTGHDAGRKPTERPHVAFLALPFVGRHEADGVLLGAALALPRDLDPRDRATLLAAIGEVERTVAIAAPADDELPTLKLVMGSKGELLVRRVRGVASRHTLKPGTWCGVSRVWATVTPLALDRNPGNLRARDPREAEDAERHAEVTIATACEHAGLPRPIAVGVAPVSLIPAAEPASAYGPFPRETGRFRRVLMHAELLFADPVRGPVIVGAGRYYGLGLCRPVRFTGEPA